MNKLACFMKRCSSVHRLLSLDGEEKATKLEDSSPKQTTTNDTLGQYHCRLKVLVVGLSEVLQSCL